MALFASEKLKISFQTKLLFSELIPRVKNKTTSSQRKIVRKIGKTLCCMFLMAIWGLTLHKTWQKTKKKVVMCAHTTN